jgi:hypothetical protein
MQRCASDRGSVSPVNLIQIDPLQAQQFSLAHSCLYCKMKKRLITIVLRAHKKLRHTSLIEHQHFIADQTWWRSAIYRVATDQPQLDSFF